MSEVSLYNKESNDLWLNDRFWFYYCMISFFAHDLLYYSERERNFIIAFN